MTKKKKFNEKAWLWSMPIFSAIFFIAIKSIYGRKYIFNSKQQTIIITIWVAYCLFAALMVFWVNRKVKNEKEI